MNLYRDLVHAVRSLAKSRAFTLVCVLSLGIGMAPVIGIQYMARAFTTPPPGVSTDGLVEVITRRAGPRGPSDRWSYPNFVDLRSTATGAEMTGWASGDATVTLSESGKTGVTALFVSSNYFRAVGVALARGTGFTEVQGSKFDARSDPAVIVAYSFWQTRLASDPDIVGKMLTIDGVPHVVAGIAAEDFEGHLPFQEAELFIPLERHPTILADAKRRFDRGRAWIHIHGRLSPGVSEAQASAAVSAFTAQLAKEYPATNESAAGIVAPYHPIGNVEGEDARIVLVLWNVLTAIPLLVVCLNLSGMVQVRSAMRERELSIRQAIGADRRRLIQYLLAESVVLALLGGALATFLLLNSLSLTAWWLDDPLPRQMQRVLTVDLSMVAVCAGLCLATSLVFGWLPAIRFSRPRIMTVLKDEAGGGSLRTGRVHKVTSALQVAIAVPMLVLSAMSLERMRATASADLGFAAELLYAAPVQNAGALPGTLSRQAGVASVTVADGLPLDFRYRVTTVSTQPGADAAPNSAPAHVTRVGEGYLETMAIPLAAGRGFTTDDGSGAPMVTMISDALAKALFPDGDAIGQRLTYSTRTGPDAKELTLTIVGVTADFPTSQITTDREQLLLPFAQHPDVRKDSVAVSDDRAGTPMLMLIARAAPGEPPAKLQAALENTIREVNPDFERTGIVTGASLRENSVNDFINASAIAGISGGVALLLAALGIYGVVGLMVATRTREIAVRVTLGASRTRVIGMILFGVIKLVGPGVVAGALITAGLARLEGGVTLSPIEPLAYVAGALIALLAAVLAGFAPARRAASVEPMVAMRST
jgi:predicted permease